MKKSIALLLVLLSVTLAAFTACANGNDESTVAPSESFSSSDDSTSPTPLTQESASTESSTSAITSATETETSETETSATTVTTTATTPKATVSTTTAATPKATETTPAKPVEPEDNTINTIGNTSSNLFGKSNGTFAGQGNWVYYSNWSDGSKLYKMKSDGTQKTKLSNQACVRIQVVGDWVYFIADALYRVKTDGTQETKISDKWAGYCVVGEWIYYYVAEYAGQGLIYKMRVDGTENTLIKDVVDGEFNTHMDFRVLGNYIYYSIYAKIPKEEQQPNGPYWRAQSRCITFDGVDVPIDQYTAETIVPSSVYDNGWFYSQRNDDWPQSGGVFKFRPDGSEKTVLLKTGSGVNNINVSNGWIYYEGADNGWGIFKIKTDGTGKTKLSGDFVDSGLCVIGNWIYYSNDGVHQYRLKTDGSVKQELK